MTHKSNDLEGYPHDHVICEECGNRFKTIEYSHLKAKHGIGIDEYESRHPNSPRVCTDTLFKLGRIQEAKEQIREYS